MDDILKTIVARIKRTADPDKIILFGSRIGSRSRGKKTDSDYDLLILKKGVTHRRSIAQQLYRELADIPIAVDIIVETPERVEKYRHTPGFIYTEALKGQTIYER
ncbi:nucleotidyltransferase domain-containing protein [Moorella naiadis]|uniref:nucleotidyltransferase domain-containing protein n=1 Tax=Moorella naiadis (nom. illeg.) TaxID=3093670 RepID=UPI003D9C8B1F